MKREKRYLIWEVIFIAILLIFVISSFVYFMRDNSRRIVEQNNNFVKTATEQTVEKIDERIAMSQRNLDMMVHLYPTIMTQPKVDTDLLKDMTERSYFDYVEFITPDGMDLAADGRTADLSDREYFIDGMKGNSGKCVVYNSRITDETLLIFYSPFYYDGEIVGVLSGILRGDTVKNVLSASYFDVQGSTYLLEPNGNVIISAGDESEPENLLTTMTENNRLFGEDQEKFERALREGSSTSFNYRGSEGAGSAYVTPLADGEWILVQNFPSSLTRSMVTRANSAGVRLEIMLIAAFVLYVLFLLWKNRRQKKQLVSEKQEMSGIVEAVTQLFTRFALVDYETDTYKYLEDKKCDAPEMGNYTDLIRYLDARYADEEDGSEKMSTVIAPDYVRAHLTEGVPYLQFEYQIDMEGRRWENISILCLERKDGLPVKALYAIQDVTALKEREQQIRLALKEASDAAEAANHAKSDFLARMSHDIRTPMNAIMGMTAVAAMHLDDRERLEDCLGKITISSRHLLALINDVLDMSKIESGKVTLSEEPFGIADMVDSVVTIIRPQANSKHQDLRVHISDITHEDVIGDTLRLRQVFVNILGNAVKFTPAGGTVTFSIRERKPLVPGHVCYEFVCEDTGVGMDKEFMKTIFDPFTRSDTSVSQKIEGTGLGMSITRNIVRLMEGDIQVESEPGAGSKFTVQVHLKKQGAEEDDIRSRLASDPESALAEEENVKKEQAADLAQASYHGRRILLVEDNELNREIEMELLSFIDVEVEVAEDGQIAVDMVKDSEPGYYDLIFMDIQMPVMNGYESARCIRALAREDAKKVPIIAMTANAFADDIRSALDAGMNDHVAKPVEVEKLLGALDKWL